MKGVLCCGPFAATESSGKVQIIFPVSTQGDWVGTEEGHEELEKAVNSLGCACDDKTIHPDTEVEWRNDDQVIVRIPCESHTQAMMQGAALKEQVSKITGAAITDIARKIG